MELDWELVHGVVPVGVSPELPVEDVSMVLSHHHLYVAVEVVRKNLESAQANQKRLYNRKA